MSGHSKWHNIQKTKGAQDAKRAAAFTKIAKELPSGWNVGLLLIRCSGQGPHLAKRWEPRGFSRVAAAFSSYDGDLTEQEQLVIKELLLNCMISYLDNDIKNQAIYLRRFYKIKLPDAIVAATAISYNVPLLTADKEFNKIKGLNLCLLNPIANQ